LNKKHKTTSWRKLAIAVYGAPNEGKVYGMIDVDVTKMLDYIKMQKTKGKRLTVTNFVIATVARALYEDASDMNCFIKRGKIQYREDVNMCCSVSIKGGKGMTAIVVPKAQDLSVTEITQYSQKKIEEKRQGNDSGAFKAKDIVAKIPWPFRRPITQFIKWWLFDLDLPFPFLKIPRDPFGSFMITNIGTWGLSTGMVALFPMGRLPGVIAIGKITEKPVVIDGKIEIRSIMPLTGTFDHRIVDGAQISNLGRGLTARLQDPEKLDSPNPH